MDEYHQVKHVHDGDTVHLVAGHKVRLIGINTPEVARDKKPAEPFGVAARDALRQLLKSERRIGVQYGGERKDRHGRILAHLYLSDGRSVQQWLLQNGYAIAVAIAPNIGHVACYQQAEQLAQSKRRGLWQQRHYFSRQAEQLQRGDGGFRLVSGRVIEVKKSKKWSWLVFGDNFSVRIAHPDVQRYFGALPLASLEQKQLTVRGWLTQRKGRWSMRVMHPAAIEIVRD